MPMNRNYEWYSKMLMIRRFEERLLDEFSKGKLTGTTHAYIGQEANAVGIMDVLNDQDVVFSNHRCHGHFLAYGGDPNLLAAEIMGKRTGVVGGRGGSQHIQWKNFYSNGIQGGIIPIATGMGLAEKIKNSGHIAVAFMGDGTLGEGIVYESLNMASLWNIPILYILENNYYAQTTPLHLAMAGQMWERFNSFGICTWECDTTDVAEINVLASDAVNYVRERVEPACLIIHTYRYAAHSKGDDFRETAEIEQHKKSDPLLVHGKRLSSNLKKKAETEVQNIIETSFSKASLDPEPVFDELMTTL